MSALARRCVQFQYFHSGSRWCSLLNTSTAPSKAKPDCGYDCGCRGKCVASSGPGPKPPKTPTCDTLQKCDLAADPSTVKKNTELNDCCDLCNTALHCNASTWEKYTGKPHAGTCSLFHFTANQIVNHSGACLLPSRLNPPHDPSSTNKLTSSGGSETHHRRRREHANMDRTF